MSDLGIPLDNTILPGASGAIGEELSQALNLLPNRTAIELLEDSETSDAEILNRVLLEQPVGEVDFDSRTGAPISNEEQPVQGAGPVRIRDFLTGFPEPAGAIQVDGESHLDFSGAINGSVEDEHGQGTGFTSLFSDEVSPQLELYVPEGIDLDSSAGTLSLSGEEGSDIFTSTLKNALQLPLASVRPFTVATRLTHLPTDVSSKSSMGGIFFGTDQDNFVQLALVGNRDGWGLEYYLEQDGEGARVGGEHTPLSWELPKKDINTLDLFITGNPLTGAVSAAYRINSDTDAPTVMPQQFHPDAPDHFFPDKSEARAGIMPTPGARETAVEYDSFAIQYAEAEPLPETRPDEATRDKSVAQQTIAAIANSQEAGTTDQAVRINFQPEAAPVPSEYIADFGEAFNAAQGYGWVTEESLDEPTPAPIDITPNARDRDAVEDQRLDTLLHMQFPSDSNQPGVETPAAWEYELPDGTYNVTVSAGDPSFFDSEHDIDIEGVSAIDSFVPSSSTPFEVSTVEVEVTDGELTIDASDGFNTKINYVEIAPSQVVINEKINFQPEEATVPTGYTPDVGEAFSEAQGFGWVTQDSGSADPTPLDITPNARDRDAVGDQRLDTLLHMQYPSDSDQPGVDTPAAWEYALPNGDYNVTLSVGDPSFFNSEHAINVEGVDLFPAFEPTSIQPFDLGVATVEVTDGRLTIDAIGGENTKINYIEIESASLGDRPSISGSDPARRETGVSQDTTVALDVDLVEVGAGVDASTLTTENVQLYRTEDNTLVPGNVQTTGGNDAIVYTPTGDLEPFENYTLRVGSGVRDQFGNSFVPFATTFSTGDENQDPLDWDFSEVFDGAPISSLTISPDGSQLYAAGLDGLLRRWTIDRSGGLTDLQTFSGLVGDDPNGPRAIIGIVFDPDDPNVLWVSHNDTIFVEPALDFTGKISKLTLQSDSDFNPVVEDYVTNLPRSAKDHLSNSLAFGPDGNLYLSQGSNSAMGAPDSTWYLRPERLLSGAILEIDPDRTPPTGGFNVQTEDYTFQDPDALGETVTTEGDYDPFAPDAPVTIYGTGIRNAYDLVWHSNGSLYVPTNGSAAGGNTPDDPDTAIDEELTNGPTQNDYLFRVEQDGYYGHPNPLREEYILNGGNPTSGEDPAEVVDTESNEGYPVGVEPTWEGFAFDFGRNRSPNGAIEYQSDTFNSAIENDLLVVEFSGGDDILALTPDPAADGDIPPDSATLVADNFVNPLDLIEDPLTGDLYVTELIDEQTGAGRITRLTPNT